jgi:hypothetical protein
MPEFCLLPGDGAPRAFEAGAEFARIERTSIRHANFALISTPPAQTLNGCDQSFAIGCHRQPRSISPT